MGNVYPGRLLDLSSGGAFVESALSLTFGDRLVITFKVHSRKKVMYLSLQAKVVYTGRFLQGFGNFYGFGVCFTHLSHEDTFKLHRALESLELSPEKKFELTP